MSATFNTVEVGCFLRRLAPPSGQYLELRVILPDGSVSQFYCRTISQALGVVERFSGVANVYVGACPRIRRGGTKNDVNTVVGFWADLDFHQIDPTNRDVALELAYRRIDGLGMRPTMLVHTGNGLQLWWSFSRPVAITDEWPAERFQSINMGLAQQLGGDHVHDLARVLRVPGTMNLPTAKKLARGCVPVMARLLDAGGPTYRPVDFQSLAASVMEARPPAALPQHVATHDGEEVVAAFERLLTDLGSAHPLARTWSGLRDPRDTSRSGWDWALVRELQRVGVREEFIPHILRAYRRGRGWLATDQYIARTIQKTRVASRGTHGSKQPIGA